MSKVFFKATARRFNNGSYLFIPATPADKRVIDSFCESAGNRYISVTASFSRSKKTYDQVKTVFALISILFEMNYDRKPSSDERELMYQSLLEDYAERQTDPRNPERTIPVSLSRMDKIQAAQFINSIISLIVENSEGLSEAQEVDLKQIFEEFQKENNTGEGNPVDYSADGNLLSVNEWCERNNISMASGINDGTLEIAHIVSKNRCPQYRNCCWNFLRLTHYEHIEIQHRKGWGELLRLYPHLRERVRLAYERAHVALDILDDELDAKPVMEYREKLSKPINTIDTLAEQALSSESAQDERIPEEEGLF